MDGRGARGERLLDSAPLRAGPGAVSAHVRDADRRAVGVVAYAFLANSKLTMDRPADEQRFQIEYGPDYKALHRIWQDPFELYTTLFVGICRPSGTLLSELYG